jgi:hypothetical protein
MAHAPEIQREKNMGSGHTVLLRSVPLANQGASRSHKELDCPDSGIDFMFFKATVALPAELEISDTSQPCCGQESWSIKIWLLRCQMLPGKASLPGEIEMT